MQGSFIQMKQKKQTPTFHFGEKVRAIRKKKNITQIVLAEKLKVTQRVISYYETEHDNPSLELVGKIARALGVTQMQLLNFQEEPAIIQEAEPIRSLQRQLGLLPSLPIDDQKFISKTIGMILERHKIQNGELTHDAQRSHR
jgi:transcriptional regulator with XRE-family HTH domain